MLREFQEEIKRLKDMIEGKIPDGSMNESHSSAAVEELHGKVVEMQQMYEKERLRNQKLEQENRRLRKLEGGENIADEELNGDFASDQTEQQAVYDEEGNVVGYSAAPVSGGNADSVMLDGSINGAVPDGSGGAVDAVTGKPLRMNPSQVAVHLRSVDLQQAKEKSKGGLVPVPDSNIQEEVDDA